MEENISSTTLIDISRYCSSIAVKLVRLLFPLIKRFFFVFVICRMVIFGHHLNHHVLDRQCKDCFLQQELVQQILIHRFYHHYHFHLLIGLSRHRLLILISIFHQFGRQRFHLNINHAYRNFVFSFLIRFNFFFILF